MSLGLLKEKFGHSTLPDDRKKLHERLNVMAERAPAGDMKSIKDHHREQMEDKQRTIENLEIANSELADEIATLEKENSTLSEELSKSKWMEDTVASTTKEIYENKIKTIIHDFESVDSSNLIPLLTTVSRKKQGNQKLSWNNWLKLPESNYLFQINQNIAKKVFEDSNALVDRNANYMHSRDLDYYHNRHRTRGGDDFASNYSLTFTGNTSGNSEYVSTAFDPDAHELYNGFTVSYWVRPDEFGNHMFALGRKYNNNERFTFGLQNSTNAYIGVGNTKKITTAHGMTANRWYHWVITFGGGSGGALKVYRDSTEIIDSTTSWTSTAGSTPIYFGGRNLQGTGYNNGWACSLDEVAIFNEVKGDEWVTGAYNSGTPTDLQNESDLVGYWRFEEGSGLIVKDLSGNGNHGTLTTDDAGLPAWSTDTPKGYE
jgi:hypothetical protein|tara:strand:- start:887 stop:2176 length:1290 start_codon:yes stop_codon:yes gene_type:complete